LVRDELGVVEAVADHVGDAVKEVSVSADVCW
jgi:hypothetical protein